MQQQFGADCVENLFNISDCAKKLAYISSVVEKINIKTFCNADILEIHREFPPPTVVQKIQKYNIAAQSPERKGKSRLFMFSSKVQKSSGTKTVQ